MNRCVDGEHHMIRPRVWECTACGERRPFKAICQFCREPAVARYAMSEGCICLHDEHEQDLCARHATQATPLGEMTLVVDYCRTATDGKTDDD